MNMSAILKLGFVSKATYSKFEEIPFRMIKKNTYLFFFH